MDSFSGFWLNHDCSPVFHSLAVAEDRAAAIDLGPAAAF
jgi:hypothetical protein